MKNPYIECPILKASDLTLRLIKEEDYVDLFNCYHDLTAVSFMNDDNCDFGFYVDNIDKMRETINYWLNFYHKQCFIRFSIVNKANKVIGTVEGFNGDIGVLRVDLMSEYNKESLLEVIFTICKENFKDIFQNNILVTKVKKEDKERLKAVTKLQWKYIGRFREFDDYYQIEL